VGSITSVVTNTGVQQASIRDGSGPECNGGNGQMTSAPRMVLQRFTKIADACKEQRMEHITRWLGKVEAMSSGGSNAGLGGNRRFSYQSAPGSPSKSRASARTEGKH